MSKQRDVIKNTYEGKSKVYIPTPYELDDNGDIPILIQEKFKYDDPGNESHIIEDGEYKYRNNDNAIDPGDIPGRTNIYDPLSERINNKYMAYDPSTATPVEIGSLADKKLMKNLCVPSASHAYSVCVEFFKNYILDKFPSGYFKTVYIDGKHLFDEFANLNDNELIKKGKPAIAFIPQVDPTFNREGIDANINDLTYYARTFNYRDTFFKDKPRDLYIGVGLELLNIGFNVKVKVNTRAKQLDLMRYMKLAYKIGATSGYYMDMDIHVPYDMLYALAKEVGFKVDEEKQEIVEPIKFLSYLNKHSEVPFIYKLRNMNARHEFFLRASNMYVHISIPDINIDDGERQNQISSNFYLEFTATVRFPAPKMYCYFSAHFNDFIRFSEGGTIKTYIANFSNIPTTNSKGWDQFITSGYEVEDKEVPVEIDINEFFDGDININRLIKDCNDKYISPSVFLDFKLFSNNKEVPLSVDWETMKITSTELAEHFKSEIVVYANKEYINDTIVTLDAAEKKRIKDTKVTNNNPNPPF